MERAFKENVGSKNLLFQAIHQAGSDTVCPL